MRYDDLLSEVGETGVFQGLVFMLNACRSFWGTDPFSMVYISYNSDHWCRIPALQDFSHNQQRNIAIPYSSDGEFESCKRYDLNYSSFTNEELLTRDRSLSNQTNTVDCDAGWVFDQSLFGSTIRSRYDLVCDRSNLSQLVSTLYFAGVLIGSITSGITSDRIGRKWTIVIGAFIKLIGMFIGTFAPHYAMFVIGRFVVGLGNTFMFLTQFVLTLELVGPKYRAWYGTGLGIVLAFGQMMTTGLAYAIRNDRTIQLVMSIPNVVFLLYIWALPESPRWLMLKGRYREAEQIIRKIAAVNKRTISKEIDFDAMRKAEGGEREQRNCGQMMTYKHMRTRTCLIGFYWFVVNLMFYALSLNSGTLYGDLFVNNIILAAVEIPANLLSIVLCNLKGFGRRLTSSVSMVMAGVSSFIAVALVLTDKPIGNTAMAVIGKAFAGMAFSAIYVFSVEVFPTEVRSAGLGSASMCGRIAGMAAPYIGAPLQRIWGPMPQLIFGVLATAAGFSILAIPETLGQKLSDTIEEAEDLHKPSQVDIATEPSDSNRSNSTK